MLSKGVTTVEAKSGYGLSLEAEIKILKVMKALQKIHPLLDHRPYLLGGPHRPKGIQK